MRLSRRRFLAASGASAFAAAWPAHANRPAVFGGSAFGSYWRISLGSDGSAGEVRRDIEAIIAAGDDILSPYRAHSELSQFNMRRSTDWTPVSPSLRTVVKSALRIAHDTRGAFDPTVGPIVNRYGFGPITGARKGSYQHLTVGPDGIRKHADSLTIDLCGIAKGYVLDRMAEALDALGHDAFLIELGGEVFARGCHPSGRPWQIAVEEPAPSGTALRHLVALNGRAIATSGVTANCYEIAGRRYSHIIDPRKLEPVNGAIASVSVMADSAMEADGVATALIAMGFEEAMTFAQDHAVDALIQASDGAGLTTLLSGRFAQQLIN